MTSCITLPKPAQKPIGVGINATQAVTVAAGRGTYSLGRVQTPTLAMVCERYWENERFVPEPVFQIHLSTDGVPDGAIVKLSSAEKWKEKTAAEAVYQTVKVCETLIVTRVECKETVQEAPLLYDLTSLQKEANTKHGFSAEKTLSVAQKLYEAKLVTYPRTGSRHIPEDVFAEVPALLLTLKNNPQWGGYIATMGDLSHRSVDDTKITDHHALLITEVKAKNLDADDRIIYEMIVGRMLEAFSDKCVKDVTTVSAACGGTAFTVKGAVVKQAGWCGVYGEKEETEEVALPRWAEGDTLPVRGSSLTEGKTKPKSLHTGRRPCSLPCRRVAKRWKTKSCGSRSKNAALVRLPHGRPSSKRFSSASTWCDRRNPSSQPKRGLPSIR